LLIEAALTVSLAHGSNDVANSIAPLLVEMHINSVNEKWAYWLGGAGIAIGLLTLGYKVIQIVGKEVIVLDFYKGFSCQFATASCIILGSKLGIPLSTTHCMVGSLFGIILCNRLNLVKRAYAQINETRRFFV
jgi:phosphate/sulfate permease